MAEADAHGDEASGRRAWLLWAAAAVIAGMLLPLGLALAAPGLASTPADALAHQAPPIPVAAPHALPSLDGLYQPLPLVAPDPVSSRSDRVYADYQRARLGNAESVARVFTDAWHSLTVSALNAAALQQLEGTLITGQAGQQGPGAPGTAFSRLWSLVASDLVRDPANAVRLSDAAAALYMLAWANLYGPPAAYVDGFRTSDPANGEFFLPNGATNLLSEAEKVFPDSVPASINLAYLDDAHAGTLLRGVLARDPGNVTARLLLSSSLARGLLTSPNPDAALATVKPLIENPHTAAIGYAARGDTYLSVALGSRDSAPFTARDAARQALAAYDKALRLTTDPGVYTGRATALDLLGMPGAAATTERRATERAQAAIGPRILLSYLQEEDGDVAGMRQSAARLIDGLRPAGWNPLVSSLSYHVFPWTSRAGTSGYLHLSYATDGGVFAITPQGGGFLQVLNAIPRTDEFTLAEFRDFSTGFAAVQAALAADVASGDPVQAVRDASFGLAAAPAPQRSAQIEAMGPLIGAARLVAGERASNLMLAFPLAQAILRDAGRFRRALDLCRSYSAHSSVGAIAEQCASESQYFLGLAATSAPDRLREDRGALAQFEAAHRDAVKHQIGDPDAILLETAFAATSTAAEERSAGNRAAASADLALARRLYTAEAGQSFANGRDVEAQTKLGDLFYEQGDLHAAIGAYTRTTAIFKRDYPHGFPDDIAVQAEEAAYNNRGISELTLTQGTPQERPDCSALHDLCLAAASDFAHALALDPADPIALMNAGWVARLLGREEEARRLLESATVADPALYPAFNDLGVLSAESGDTTTARRDFEAALTANPRYDLAAWNLGVLDTREGLGTIIQGQAYLSRAIAENRSLRSSELEYKTDERVYRYVVGVDAPNGQALDRGYGIAAATLGWLTLLAALYAIGKHLLTDVAQERLAEFWDERVPELRERLMSRVRNWLRHLVGSGSDNIEPGKGTDRPDGSADQSDESTRRSRYPWWLALPALVLITLFLARRTSPDAALPAAALTLAATAIALLVHEAGHRVVAGYIKAQVTPEHWGSSIPLAVLAALVPAETNMGPFMGHRVEGEESAERHHWVYVGGPAANLVMAAVAYALFLAQPLPFFRLLAAVQLAVCAYALLPVEPLDGAELEEKHHIMLPLTAVLTAAGVALALGIL